MEVCFFHHHASVSERYWINRPSAAAITHMLMYCYKSTAYNTLDHSVLPPMWQQFVFGSAVFQQDKVPLCTKPDSLKKKAFPQFGVEELDWHAEPAPFGELEQQL